MATRWTHLPAHPGSPQTNRGGNTCAHVHTHSNKQPGMHKPQHLFFIITIQSAGGKVGLCYTAAECVRWAVIDTRPQTWVVTKKYRKDPAGIRKRAVRGIVQYTSCAGTQLCPLQAHVHTHRYSLKQTQDCLWHRLCFIWFGCNLASARQ